MKQEWALIANLQAGHKTSLKKMGKGASTFECRGD